MKRWKLFLSLACNLLIVLLTAMCLADFFTRGGEGNMQVVGTRAFIYFTVDSNVLCALASLGMVVWGLFRMRRRGAPIPLGLGLFKFVGTAAVSLTFCTVMAFLGPLYGYGAMFTGNNLYLHLVTPLLAVFSYTLLEKGGPAGFGGAALGVLPTVAYGAVYLSMVVILRRWADFYAFNRGGRWYVSVVLMLLASWLISLILWLANHGRPIPAGARRRR